jgi:hypothetical protein
MAIAMAIGKAAFRDMPSDHHHAPVGAVKGTKGKRPAHPSEEQLGLGIEPRSRWSVEAAHNLPF